MLWNTVAMVGSSQRSGHHQTPHLWVTKEWGFYFIQMEICWRILYREKTCFDLHYKKEVTHLFVFLNGTHILISKQYSFTFWLLWVELHSMNFLVSFYFCSKLCWWEKEERSYNYVGNSYLYWERKGSYGSLWGARKDSFLNLCSLYTGVCFICKYSMIQLNV